MKISFNPKNKNLETENTQLKLFIICDFFLKYLTQ